MKIRLLPLLFFILFTGILHVSADMSLEFTPEPQHGQLWSPNEYQLNITGPVVDLTQPEYDELTLSGNLVYNVTIIWRGTGQYFHGGSVTGYSYSPIYSYRQNLELIAKPGTNFDVSLDKYSYPRVKPFEEVQLFFKIDALLEVIEGGEMKTGPLVESISRSFKLVNNEKVEYLNDKFVEIQEDVNLTVTSAGLEQFNRTKYTEYVNSMNHSLLKGDYSEALDLWEKWDKKERINMFAVYVREVGVQTIVYESLMDSQANLEKLRSEYDHLNDKYVAIFKEKNQNLAELEATKQGLSTAITGVFLSAIVFFFLGRRTTAGEKNDA